VHAVPQRESPGEGHFDSPFRTYLKYGGYDLRCFLGASGLYRSTGPLVGEGLWRSRIGAVGMGF